MTGIESKFHRPPPVKKVLVSQATRQDARGPKSPKFESYEEERDYYINQKKQLESELVGYSKASFSAEQAKIRRKYVDNKDASFRAWMSCRESMESRRIDLVQRQSKVDQRLVELKSLVKAERVRENPQRLHEKTQCPLAEYNLYRENGSLSWDGVAAHILLELKAIRVALERHSD